MSLNIKTAIARTLPPTADNPRNSEGDFIRLKDGRILFVFSRFHGDSTDDGAPCDIAALWSSDNGKSFPGEPVILARGAEYGVTNLMSVSLMRMADGDLGLFFLVKDPDETDRGVLLRSHDEGETFDKPLHVLPFFKGYYVVNNNRIERTASGRLVIPAAMHRVSVNPDGTRLFDGRGLCYFFLSDDDGRTWREARDVVYPNFGHTWAGLQEPGVITLPSGALMGYARTDKGCQYRFFSYDDGESWTPAEPSQFTSPVSPLKIARNPWTGVYYAVWNPIPSHPMRTDGGWGRKPLVLAESTDGVNFGQPVLLEDEFDTGYCYPALFFADKDTLLLSYCSGGPADGNVLAKTTVLRIAL